MEKSSRMKGLSQEQRKRMENRLAERMSKRNDWWNYPNPLIAAIQRANKSL